MSKKNIATLVCLALPLLSCGTGVHEDKYGVEHDVKKETLPLLGPSRSEDPSEMEAEIPLPPIPRQRLSIEQVRTLTNEEIQNMNAEQLSLLTAEEIQDFSNDQLRAFTPQQTLALRPEQADGLIPRPWNEGDPFPAPLPFVPQIGDQHWEESEAYLRSHPGENSQRVDSGPIYQYYVVRGHLHPFLRLTFRDRSLVERTVAPPLSSGNPHREDTHPASPATRSPLARLPLSGVRTSEPDTEETNLPIFTLPPFIPRVDGLPRTPPHSPRLPN